MNIVFVPPIMQGFMQVEIQKKGHFFLIKLKLDKIDVLSENSDLTKLKITHTKKQNKLVTE